MEFTLSKDLLVEQLQLASRFTSNRLASTSALQGVLLKVEESTLHIFSTNLNAYFHTTIVLKDPIKAKVIVEPKKILEFLMLLNPGDITISINEKQVVIAQAKTRGSFPVIMADDFPLPPLMKEEEQKMDAQEFVKKLPLVLFTASNDDTRPVLTGVNFVNSDGEFLMVSTDGFRLSIIKEKRSLSLPSMIIPSDFLSELIRNVKTEKNLSFVYSEEEKIMKFSIGNTDFYTRLIDGDFPPFERVVPTEMKTKVIVDRSEFIRNIKLISIFAREYSNIVICEFTKEGLTLKPKKEADQENTTSQEIEIEGEDQKVAFNLKYVLDLLNHIHEDTIVIELLRSDAPVCFKIEKDPSFLHIIMPVRITE